MPERFWTRKIGTSIVAPQQMNTIAATDYIEAEMNGDGCARDTTMQLRIAIKEDRTKESELVLGYIADEVAWMLPLANEVYVHRIWSFSDSLLVIDTPLICMLVVVVVHGIRTCLCLCPDLANF
jgi:hypothetical protein